MSGSNSNSKLHVLSLDKTVDEREEENGVQVDDTPQADHDESAADRAAMPGGAGTSGPGKKTKVILVSVVGVFLVALAGGGYYLFKPSDRTPWQTLPTETAVDSKESGSKADRYADDRNSTESGVRVSTPATERAGDGHADNAERSESIIQAATAAGIEEAFALGANNTATVLHAAEIAYQKAIEAGATHEEAKAAANAAVEAILAANPMTEIETNAILAHIETALDRGNSNTQDRLSYLAQSVAGAVAAAGGTHEEQVAFAENAIDVKSGYINADTSDIRSVKASLRNDLGATGVEQGASAAQEVDPQNAIADSAVEDITSGLDSALSKDPKPLTQESITEVDAQRFVELAAAEADRLGLTGQERERFIVQKAAELSAEARNLSALEIELAGVTALAKHNALERGASSAEARRLADQAALAYMDSKGVPPEIQDAILYRIDSTPWSGIVKAHADEGYGAVASVGAGRMQDASLDLSGSTDAAIGTRVSLLENRLDSLVTQVSETNRLIVRLSQAQEQQIRDTDTRMNAFASRLDGFEGAIKRAADNSLGALKESVSKLTANFGWISNRLCEEEARSGAFNNENACGAIYDRIRSESSNKVMASTTAIVSTTAVTSTLAPDQANANTGDNLQPEVRRYGIIPATKGFIKPTIAKTVVEEPAAEVAEAEPVKEVNLCERAIDSFNATKITESSAIIQNRWGAKRQVMINTFIDGLGSVKSFGPNADQPYVEFSNAVVCG